MSKFTKSLIAAALAVAVAGPAAADGVMENGTYNGTKMKIQIKPSTCKNVNVDVPQAELELDNDSSYRQAGYWYLTGSVTIGDDDEIEGYYVERKVGKDLTGSLYEPDLGSCGLDSSTPPVRVCDGIVGRIVDVVESSECGGSMSITQSNDFIVTKGNVKLSKKGERAKVDFKLEGEFTNDKGKVKKVQATIKSPNMDFVADTSS